MSRPSIGTERTPVVFDARPGTRAWTAMCFAVGGIVLAVALGLTLGERALGAHEALADQIVRQRLDAAGAR